MICDTGICLGSGHNNLESFCQFCTLVRIMLLEVIHKDDISLDARQGSFITCMLKFRGFQRIIYCIDASLHLICYKNSSLRGGKYIHEVPKLHNLYTSMLLWTIIQIIH